MVLVIDNYDSFTYNLVQLVRLILRPTGEEVVVYRNDEIVVRDVGKMKPTRLLFSPGPGRPEHAGITMDAIRQFAGTIPILGICLGHQAIGAVFGGEIVQAPVVMHGKTSLVRHTGSGIFESLRNPLRATRYHSLVIDPESLPEELEAIAWSDDGVIMAVRHKCLPLVGVQFHPESILTDDGEKLLRNWLGMKDSP